MKRSSGITLLALLLFLLGIGAFILAMTAETLVTTAARWRLVQVGALFYGLTATVAGVGLWKVRSWGYVAFVAWVAAVLAVGLWWPAVFPQFGFPWWAPWLWIAIMAAIMLPLGGYVRRAVRIADRRDPDAQDRRHG